MVVLPTTICSRTLAGVGVSAKIVIPPKCRGLTHPGSRPVFPRLGYKERFLTQPRMGGDDMSIHQTK